MDNKKINLVIGAGFSGATIARLLADKGEQVLLVDKRNHIAGNSYDFKDKNGILIHKYGSHIFHTSNIEVWNFLRRFSDFNTYFHKVKAVIDGIETNIPFNLDTIKDLFPESLSKKLEEKLLSNFSYNQRISILELQKYNDKDLNFLAHYIYEKVFFNYSEKHWGMSLEQLDSFVSSRVPILIGRNPNYFHDTYQGIPMSGYTSLIENMLDNQNIEVRLSVDSSEIISPNNCGDFKRVFNTASIDEFFGYKYGKLPYRSIRLDITELDIPYYQSNSVINYPCNYDFTRIHEFKYYLNKNCDKTVIAKEYAEDFEIDKNERCYPILNTYNQELYKKYQEDVKSIKNLIFLGRLGEYKYYDMDKAIARVLDVINLIS